MATKRLKELLESRKASSRETFGKGICCIELPFQPHAIRMIYS